MKEPAPLVLFAFMVPTNLTELADQAELYGVNPSNMVEKIFGSFHTFAKWNRQFRCDPSRN